MERQRAEAEAVISKARPNVESFEAEIAEATEKLEEAKRPPGRAFRGARAPAPRGPSRLRLVGRGEARRRTLAERTTYAERVLEARARDLEALDAQTAEHRAQLQVKKVSAARIEPLLALFDDLIAQAQRWTRSLEDQASAAESASSGLHTAATEARAKAHEAHALFDGTTERLSEARVQKGRLELQVEAAVNHITVDCKTPLETALALPPLEDRAPLEDELFKINRRIANLGTINPDAAEEYDELKVRYDYLAAQLEDLDSAPPGACRRSTASSTPV